MQSTINFDINPYFDDYDETKGFVRVLYIPGRAVQARELTQQQTILQAQIDRFGSSIYKDGSKVTGAEHFIDLDITYLKLLDNFSGSIIDVNNFLEQDVVGQTSGARGKVILGMPNEGQDSPTLFVKMLSGFFVDGETIIGQKTFFSASLLSSGAVGKSSGVGIAEGVYFVNGIFAFVNKQFMILDKYSNTPSYRIGLSVVDSIVTEEDDRTLLDNATGSRNENAPGAHRYKIDLILDKKGLGFDTPLNNASSAKFVEILRIENGVRTKDVQYAIYSDLDDTLARRTFDESGNYTVDPFKIDIQDHPFDDTKLRIALDAGKAYVKGYEHSTITTEYIEIDKARTTSLSNNFDINAQYGNYVIVNNLSGVFDTSKLVNVNLLSSNVAGTTSGNFGTNTIGTASVRYIEQTAGSSVPYAYRLYLFNINLTSGSIGDVKSVWAGNFAAGNSADIDQTRGVDVNSKTLLFGSSFNSLIFKTPNTAVRTLKPGGLTDTSFATQRSFDVTMTAGVGTINTSGSNTFFGASGALASDVIRQNYIAIATTVTNAAGTGLSAGDVVDFTVPGRSITLSGGNQTATLNIGAGSFTGELKIIATVNLNEKNEKIKTVATKTVTGLTLTGGKASLNHSDIIRINSIIDTGDSNADVTNLFILDNGQRDNFYDHGSISLVSGATVVGPLDVEFDYFIHSGSGYFSVDSYSSINYTDIPNYQTNRGEIVSLRDVIDFRPRRADNLTTFDIGSDGADLARPNGNISADYEFYLPRFDKLILTSGREFKILSGVPSLNPVSAIDEEDAMTLYHIYVPAYTNKAADVTVEYIENRRYTMKDISDVDKRLLDLEYYTALSLLEKEAKDRIILDSAGIELFKTGILVDSFSGHSVGDVRSDDYVCSIDFENKFLRPSFNSSFVALKHETILSSGANLSGDLFMLDYTEESFVSQPQSSGDIELNPFNLTQWNGVIELSKSVDNWYDTQKTPKVITNSSGENDAWIEKGFGTQWNDWIANWFGSQINPDVYSQNTSTEISRNAPEIIDISSKIRSKFSPQAILRRIGSKITNESVVPYIRNSVIEFTAYALKPNTVYYPFFDSQRISSSVAPEGGTFGDPILTDDTGKVSGVISLTNEFRTGDRLFRLTDSITNNFDTTTSSAEVVYSARGASNKEASIVSTRNSLTRRNSIEDNITIKDAVTREKISTSLGSLYDKNWTDPLAQLFTVDAHKYKRGVFVSSLDLFFTSKDENLPVVVELRPVVGGYPHTSTIIPFSQVVLEASDISAAQSGGFATNVKFKSPVYLAPGTYAICVITDSDQYKLSSGVSGSLVTNMNLRITDQPYVGGLFRPQNGSQYSVNLNEAIKFQLNKCKFTTFTGSIVVNASGVSDDIETDLIHILSGKMNIPGCSMTYNYKIKDEATGNIDSNWIQIAEDRNFEFTRRKLIEATDDNSIQLKIDFETVDQDVSPVIDLQKFGVIAVSNIVNNDASDEDSSAGGNALARYMTRRVTLGDGFDSDGLRVQLQVYNTGNNSVKVYAKSQASDDSTDFASKDWKELPLISAPNLSRYSNDFVNLEFGDDEMPTFKTFAVKIVMLSNNPTDVPKVRNMKIIALSS